MSKSIDSRAIDLPLLTAAMIFALLLLIGFWLAAKKPMWNDEVYSQVHSIQKCSYAQILAGGVAEGNVSPLFYVLQKMLGSAFGYALPVPWDGEAVVDSKAQWIFRVLPNVCMSLAMALMVYFFVRVYGWIWGLYALLLSLSSFMVWAYWAEARPYALWVLLTTAQTLILIGLLRDVSHRDTSRQQKWFVALGVTNLLLALTVVFSIIQIAVVTLLVWGTHTVTQLSRKWQRYIWISLLPIGVALFYYSRAPHYTFWMESPWGLLDLNVSADVLWVAGIYAVGAGLLTAKAKRLPPEGWACWLLTLMLIAASLALMAVMTFGHGREGFVLSARYFIFLAPVGIITATVLAKNLVTAAQKNWWVLAMLVMVLAGLLIIRCLKAYMLILGAYAF